MKLWYVSKTAKGYTADPADAQATDQGYPIVARGISAQIEREITVRHMQLWEELLDQMEVCYGLQEELGRTERRAEDRRDTLTEALAILIYGKSSDPAVWADACNLIKRQAELRYDNAQS